MYMGVGVGGGGGWVLGGGISSPLGSRVSPKSERGARGTTPKKHDIFFLLCGWCGGGVVVWWGVLPFCTLDHVGTIFFKFLVL